MMGPRAAFFQVAGLLVVTWLTTRLPDDVWALTQAVLLVVSALLLLVLALAMVVRPLRLMLFRLYGVAHDVDGPNAATPEETRGLLAPLFTALACLFVAMTGTLLR